MIPDANSKETLGLFFFLLQGFVKGLTSRQSRLRVLVSSWQNFSTKLTSSLRGQTSPISKNLLKHCEAFRNPEAFDVDLVVFHHRRDQVILFSLAHRDRMTICQVNPRKSERHPGALVGEGGILQESVAQVKVNRFGRVFDHVARQKSQVAAELHQKMQKNMDQVLVPTVQFGKDIPQKLKQGVVGLLFLDSLMENLHHDHAERDLNRVGLEGMQEVAVAAFGDDLQVAVVFVVIDNLDHAHWLKIAVTLACACAPVTFDDEIAAAIRLGVHGADQARITKLPRIQDNGLRLADHGCAERAFRKLDGAASTTGNNLLALARVWASSS